MKVSVIIAVYNVEEYLERCIDSVLSQTLEGVEVILVDDGSTDKSSEILDSYGARYPQVRVLHKENGGAAAARNLGLQAAQGEFIGFLDSDDYIDPEMLSEMYEKAVADNSDIVECNLRHTYPAYEDVEVMEKITDKKDMLRFGRYVVWNKLYRKSFLDSCGVSFPEGVIYEDVAYIANMIPFYTGYSYVDIAPVHYVQRLSSVNNSTDLKTLHIFAVLDDILKFYEEKGLLEEYAEPLEYLFTRILLCSSLGRMCRMGSRAERKRGLKENYAYLTGRYPGWKRNPTLKALHSHQAWFMRSVNKVTYPVYCGVLPPLFRLKSALERKSRKWS